MPWIRSNVLPAQAHQLATTQPRVERRPPQRTVGGRERREQSLNLCGRGDAVTSTTAAASANLIADGARGSRRRSLRSSQPAKPWCRATSRTACGCARDRGTPDGRSVDLAAAAPRTVAGETGGHRRRRGRQSPDCHQSSDSPSRSCSKRSARQTPCAPRWATGPCDWPVQVAGELVRVEAVARHDVSAAELS